METNNINNEKLYNKNSKKLSIKNFSLISNINNNNAIPLKKVHSKKLDFSEGKNKKLKLKLVKTEEPLKLNQINTLREYENKENNSNNKNKTRNSLLNNNNNNEKNLIKTKSYLNEDYKELPLINSHNNNNINNNNIKVKQNNQNEPKKNNLEISFDENNNYFESEVKQLKKIHTLNSKLIDNKENTSNINNSKLKIKKNKIYFLSPMKSFYKKYFKIKTFQHKHKKHKNENKMKKNNLSINKNDPDPSGLTPNNIKIPYYKYPQVKTSSNQINKYIKSFAVNSYQGLIRDYNEDKVSIILSINKPKNYDEYWPICSYLAIYDGHGGSKCCDYLRDNLHRFIIKNEFFPKFPEKSILKGIEIAEKNFKEIAIENNDYSGSCAIIILLIDEYLYLANVGDSRCLISKNSGKDFEILNNIHRPTEENEYKRIIENGGTIYISKNKIKRINPGRLSISRAIGDVTIKDPNFGGNKDILICEPEIKKIKIDFNNTDFILLASDGIFENLNYEDCIKGIWNVFNEKKFENIHEFLGNACDMVIKTALKRNSSDNVTCVILGFENLKKKFKEKIKLNFNSLLNNNINSNNVFNNNNNNNKLINQNIHKIKININAIKPVG